MSLDDIFGAFPGGRPQHEDFRILVDIVLRQDGRSYDPDFSMPEHLGQFVDPESIEHMVHQRSMRLLESIGRNPANNPRLVAAVSAAMLDAFMIGYLFHQQRGDKPPG